MNVRGGLVVALVAGCSSGEPCDAVIPGAWTASGTCFGLARTMTVAFDEDTCAVRFEDWATATGIEPTGGLVLGARITLEGGGFDGCVGELDGASIIGTCPDSCAFELGTTP